MWIPGVPLPAPLLMRSQSGPSNLPRRTRAGPRPVDNEELARDFAATGTEDDDDEDEEENIFDAIRRESPTPSGKSQGRGKSRASPTPTADSWSGFSEG